MKNFYLDQQIKLKRSLIYRETFIFLAAYAIVIYALVVAWFSFNTAGIMYLFILVLTSLFLRFVVSELIHRLTKQARPYQRFSFTPVQSILFTTKHKPHDSFPSDHEFILAFLATCMLAIYSPLFWIALLLAPLIGYSRIILGYHYISDLAGGLILGFIFGLLFNLFLTPTLFT